MNVEHDLQHHRFVGCEKDELPAYDAPDESFPIVHYHMDEAQRMVITRTYVPIALRGGGRAAAVTRSALQYALDEDFTVVPQCTFTRRYLERNAEDYVELEIENS